MCRYFLNTHTCYKHAFLNTRKVPNGCLRAHNKYYQYCRVPSFEDYKFSRFSWFLGLPQNQFHQKLPEILSLHALQTEEKTILFSYPVDIMNKGLHLFTYNYQYNTTKYSLVYSQTNLRVTHCVSRFWSIDKWSAHRMTWLRAYLNYSQHRIKFCTSL